MKELLPTLRTYEATALRIGGGERNFLVIARNLEEATDLMSEWVGSERRWMEYRGGSVREIQWPQ